MPFDFPTDEDYETLSGLITKLNKDILKDGDVINTDEYQIKVIKMFRTSPEVVEITLFNKPQVEEENTF